MDEDKEELASLTAYPGKLWMFFISKPRHEKKLFELLQAAQIPSYLPLLRRLYIYHNCKNIRHVPMFPGYVFACTGPDEHNLRSLGSAVLRANRLEEHAAEQLLEELKVVRKFELLSASHEVDLAPELTPGAPVLITRGVFQGTYAIVQKKKNNYRITVNLKGLSYAASVELDPRDLELA
jgi:hypothetical protein